MPKSRVLIVGCGYLGSVVADFARDAGHTVYTTTRRPSRATELQRRGFQPIVADWTDRSRLQRLPEVDRVLVAVSYDASSGVSRYESQVGGLRNLLGVVNPQAPLCYISTTGVYHQTDGRWVDERSPTKPNREGGKVHLQAEDLLHRHRPNAPWTILRLAGIYGPDRVPRIANLLKGQPIASPEEGYLNLIHVVDAARAVIAAWQHPEHRLFVVGDDEPMQRREFYCQIARQCGVSPPVFQAPEQGSAKQMRSESNKRIWNRRLKEKLLPKLAFPTYREGLAQILKNQRF
ncbi:NAD dependent epimerase/dehydratase family protein [Novipirellula galeiformis]|uniref:NAD dependent epimerase/dehydratase family protein n=1 Tax=Novipirellula galeiformis TaxID=2528004 RepID=A0A5C6CJG7_9BACT|nr:SDR family oxidoreductase [Novipirellula galeiformis]TWU23491.1 NAD dependent epimerase/dehydratase family protein [Novipirellula galeiformis]